MPRHLAGPPHRISFFVGAMSRCCLCSALLLVAACPGFVKVSQDAARDIVRPGDNAGVDVPVSTRDSNGALDHSAFDRRSVDVRPSESGSPPTDASPPTGSFGNLCTNFGETCPDGVTYCIAEPFDAHGYCSKLCFNAKTPCSGGPPGTAASCVIQAKDPGGGPVLLCGFLCDYGGKTYPCPAWSTGSYCDADKICHPK